MDDFRRLTMSMLVADRDEAGGDPLPGCLDSAAEVGAGALLVHSLPDSSIESVLAETRRRNCKLVADCNVAPFEEEDRTLQHGIKEAAKSWVARGVDGLRFGSSEAVPLWFWQELVSDLRREAPHLFLVGDGICHGVPKASVFEQHSGMRVSDYELRRALEEAFVRDGWRGFGRLGELFQADGAWLTASSLVTFVDTPGLPRFESLCGDPVKLRLATLLVMMVRGIPSIECPPQHALQGGPSREDLRKLAQLRARNLAVQKGGMFLHAVTPDLFVFSRRYMGACVVVALNKSFSSSLRVADLPLPNGSCRCLMTGRELEVSDGWATFELEAGDFLVFERPGPVLDAPVCCEFQLNGLHTRFGEDVFVTGDCPELGQWDCSRAVRMDYVNGNTWCVDVPFRASFGRTIAWKYLIRSTQGLDREPVLPRTMTLPEAGSIRVRDDWGRS